MGPSDASVTLASRGAGSAPRTLAPHAPSEHAKNTARERGRAPKLVSRVIAGVFGLARKSARGCARGRYSLA